MPIFFNSKLPIRCNVASGNFFTVARCPFEGEEFFFFELPNKFFHLTSLIKRQQQHQYRYQQQ
eukprot:m.121244 g.121244  ORF g.121244 m.121244 type:complete len:63 (+) comp12920_c6_seq7:1716-1904(+)